VVFIDVRGKEKMESEINGITMLIHIHVYAVITGRLFKSY
jgi:hypothetical protein